MAGYKKGGSKNFDKSVAYVSQSIKLGVLPQAEPYSPIQPITKPLRLGKRSFPAGAIKMRVNLMPVARSRPKRRVFTTN